jgi:ADP-ribosyl-[dinitrogen reductase] hydrolase
MEPSTDEEYLNRYKGSMIGMAVGDAYGTTFEFIPRHAIKPDQLLTDDFMGGGKFKLMKGMFTDDTSLALIQSESLLDFYSSSDKTEILEKLENCYSNQEVADNIDEQTTCLRGADINKKSLSWYNKGHFSADGTCFDIGATTLKYLLKNERENHAFCLKTELHDSASGNGALMRLAPVPLYFYGLYLRKRKEIKTADHSCLLHRVIEESGFSAMTTHPSQMAIDCNRYMAALIIGCLQNFSKNDLLKPLFVPKGLPEDYWIRYPLRPEVYDVVNNCMYKTAEVDSIVNSGFSVKALESALWAFYKYDDFMEGMMEVVKLGDDSDTVGAIYGQLAGCFYGLDKIPKVLVEKCVYSKFICLIANEVFTAPRKIGENSWVYINVMKVFELLEREYLKINEKINPSRRQFKTIVEFKSSVLNMKLEFDKFKEGVLNNKFGDCDDIDCFKEISDSLFNDFYVRCNEYVMPKLESQMKHKIAHASLLSQLTQNK